MFASRWSWLWLVGGLVAWSAGDLSAQVVVQGAAGGEARWNYASPSGQTLSWLMYPQIQSELDLVTEQKESIDKIRSEMGVKLQDGYKELATLEPAARQQKYFEMYNKVGAETEKKIEGVLLPHQLKRIRQIELQMKLANSGYGSAAALHSGDVAKELGITPDQMEELKKKEAELRQEIQEKTREFYKKLNDESREKLLNVLTSAQRQKLKDLEGDRFEWKATTTTAQPGARLNNLTEQLSNENKK